MERVLFTSESVSEGHPDKVADQISDAILDGMLQQDPNSRVACETLVTTGTVVVSGEVTSTAYVDIQEVVRSTIRKIGYTQAGMGFDADACGVMVMLHKQSPDISQGVTAGQGLFKEQGAGDQGLMFGYACNETPELMPLPIMLAQKLVFQLARLRKSRKLTYLRPDAKSQVTVEYVDGKPKRIDSVIVSTQHAPEASHARIRNDIIKKLVKPVCGKYLDAKTKYYINPTGRFVIGGPHGDTGLTGRKIIVDTYGGMARHGGGAFSGKDPSKVDRSAAYMARYIAKNLVAAGAAKKCEIQLAYAIGVADPVSVLVDTFGTGAYSNEKLSAVVRKVFPLKPAGIISHLKLKKVRYCETAAYGHFGRTGDNFTWEKLDKVNAVKKELKA
ncbi:MAG: methionine adenosyltransferase [Candidatus Raymondbacteria bacterium RifOxyA12_full_50_37]|nr:MAG: methionine adenosyltransferase [Candidatus Raymondbacteria bacterium RifOxyA12_full_50_37]OGJ89006.1 MAG: methionine adenosyltransferase [Candidatus Raymondbacteria bacterium RIFOXYA2_FULL_49_16]OGJ97033.1 MAG: methionine adenosyltransferase [Candidatus Raymondbacteria bacterium RIFOXYC2_FULL_50_21]OGP42028.1 MAG: methionine adenosyltransferase [Candidatus Raymondbacteria bacterium RIFOXYB2_FULL_49_35]